MKLSQFYYDLPPGLIAEYPSEKRDMCRLMVVHRATGKIEHKTFKDIIDYFEEGDTFVLNDTKVFPARLHGIKERTSAEIEVFLLRELSKEHKLWDVIVDPARKIRIGNKIIFDDESKLVAEIIDNTTNRGRTLRFLYDGTYDEYIAKVKELGKIPLPKYIKRDTEAQDADTYQTIYAAKDGAVAAPTAGLHFSKHLLKRLEILGIDLQYITLHIGYGTFGGIEVEDITKHTMDAEYAHISTPVATSINQAIKEKRRICAVGTTTVRALESSLTSDNFLRSFEGWTSKFIHPNYNFSIPNSMITNFHLPKSTLIIMVAAFMGYDLTMKAYKEAVKEKYRFYSYGDAMLIL